MQHKVYSFEPVWPRAGDRQLTLDGAWEVGVADRPWLDKPWGLARVAWTRVKLPDGLQDALCRAGVIPNPWCGQNWRQTQWVFHNDWWFRKTWTMPPSWAKKRIRLTFDGLDYYARIWLNGQYLGFHEGAYGGPTFDVSGCLRFGEPNELLIRAGQARDQREYSPIVKPSTLRSGAIAWGNKHASVGIYAPVRLVATEDCFLECPLIQTKSLGKDQATLWVQCHIHNLGGACHGTVELEIHPWPDGPAALATSFRQKMPAGESMLEREIELPSPRLWWPNGLGAPNLYAARFTLRREDGQSRSAVPALPPPRDGSAAEDELSLRFGVRTLELVRNPIDPETPRRLHCPTTVAKDKTGEKPAWQGFADGDRAAPGADGLLNPYLRSPSSDMVDSLGDVDYRFCFQVNGREFYAGGASWLPVTDTMSNLPDRYRWLLHLAQAANLRLLRMNGGSTPFERQQFYDRCDELGILVWQEATAAGSPPPYGKRLDVWREQLTQNVFRLRPHPCLALWVFGNELDPYEPEVLAIAGLTREICSQLDPSRTFRSSSPGGGAKHAYHPADLLQAEANWYLDQYGNDAHFISEWSSSAMLSEAALRRVVKAAELDDRPVGYDWEDFCNRHPDLLDHWAESYSQSGPRSSRC